MHSAPGLVFDEWNDGIGLPPVKFDPPLLCNASTEPLSILSSAEAICTEDAAQARPLKRKWAEDESFDQQE